MVEYGRIIRGGNPEALSNTSANGLQRKVSMDDLPVETMEVGANSYEQVVNIDKWASSLAKILDDVPQYMCRPGHPGKISRIPENLREIDVKSYEPYIVSIGPYHHGRPCVQRIEKRKMLALKCVLSYRTKPTLKDYLEEIRTVEPLARSFYSEINMDSEEFVQMLLLDSLYIVTTFCGMPNSQERTAHTDTGMATILDNGDINERRNMANTDTEPLDDSEILREDEPEGKNGGDHSMTRLYSLLFEHDLFLLENQLPFFVLQKVFALTYGCSETQFIGIMKDRVSMLLPGYTKLNSDMLILPTEEVHHLLHLCHLFFCPTFRDLPTVGQFHEPAQMFRQGSAMQLYEAGVCFEARSHSTQHSLLDITFDKSGKLTMPCLHVDDNTGSLLRNLIAPEQMKYPSIGLNVSAYAVLLLHLVTTPEDARLLRHKGIIQHHLASDKEMMYLVNKLSVGLSFDYAEDNYSLKPVFKELKRFTDHRGPRWRAWLTHRYFKNPWTTISLVAASILLILSIVETFYSVYSYYHPYFGGHS